MSTSYDRYLAANAPERPAPKVDDLLPYFSHRPTCELLTHARVLRVAVCTCGLTELIRRLTDHEDD